jgi:hypothetical protein
MSWLHSQFLPSHRGGGGGSGALQVCVTQSQTWSGSQHVFPHLVWLDGHESRQSPNSKFATNYNSL